MHQAGLEVIEVSEKIGEHLLDEALGPDWREIPTQPLVARVYLALRRWSEAAAAYESLAGQRPDNGRVHFYAGYSALMDGKSDRAIAAFERAIELGQWTPWASFHVGSAYALKGDEDSAFDWLEKAVELGFSDRQLIEHDSNFDDLRKAPRYEAILNRLSEDGES